MIEPVFLSDLNLKEKEKSLIIKYINSNIKSIIEVFIDFYEMDIEYDIFPYSNLFYSRDSNLKLLFDLHEAISSSSPRLNFKPKYELTLYIVMKVWKEICDSVENLLPIKLEDNLIQLLDSYEYSYDEYGSLAQTLQDYDLFMDLCFEDRDFLPDSVANLVQLYVYNYTLYEMSFNDIDLDEYLDVMPQDIKEIYLENKASIEKSYMFEKHSEESILLEVIAILLDMEKRIVEISNRTETEISNDMCQTLKQTLKIKHNLEVTRESPIGRANVKMGETDLYIYKNTKSRYKDIAIIENKFIEKIESEYYQLLGYLNKNFDFGIQIAINRHMNYSKAINKLETVISKWKNDDCGFEIINIRKPFEDFQNIYMTTHILPEDPNRNMNIYHIILNLFDENRSVAAKKARKKKNE